MAQKTWSGGPHDWTDTTRWGGTLPGLSDDVLIPTGEPIVTTNVGTVRSVTVATSPIYGNVILAIHGGTLAISGQLLNMHRTEVGDSNSGGTLTIGTLVNQDIFTVGNGFLKAAATATVTTLGNTGTITVDGGSQLTATGSQALLNVKAAAGDGTPGHLKGTYVIAGNGVLQFASGKITTIDGTVSLQGAKARIADSAAPDSNSALSTLSSVSQHGSLSISGGILLQPPGAFSNAGNVAVDAATDSEAGGSRFAVAGALSNTGTIELGVEHLYADARLSAASIDNAGGIDIKGSVSDFAAGTGRARVDVTGRVVNRDTLYFNAYGVMTAGSLEETASSSTVFGIKGTAAGQFTTIASKGDLALDGGLADIDAENAALAAGQSFVLMTFAPGHLTGLFDTLDIYNPPATDEGGPYVGSGTAATIAGGTLKAGLVYDDAAGTITFKVVAAPTTTLDTFAGIGAFTTTADWSAGLPTFYTDAVVGSGAVTLAQAATINSLTLAAGTRFTSLAGSDLHIGATVAVGTGATLAVGGAMAEVSAVTNNGTVALASNAVADIRGNSGGTGRYTLAAGSTLDFGAAASNTVAFAGTGATLKLDHAYQFSGTLADLATGDAVDLLDTMAASATVSGTTLTIRKADTAVQTYRLANLQAGTGFTIESDGTGGSKLVVTPTAPVFSGSVHADTLAGGTPHPVAVPATQPILLDHTPASVLT